VPNALDALRAKADWLEELIANVTHLAGAGVPERAIARRLLGAEGATNAVSRGEVSKRNLVRAVGRAQSTVNSQQSTG
jgi:hypothetical protein